MHDDDALGPELRELDVLEVLGHAFGDAAGAAAAAAPGTGSQTAASTTPLARAAPALATVARLLGAEDKGDSPL